MMEIFRMFRAQHLPQLISIEKNEALFEINVTSQTMKLRDIIDDRQLMEAKGDLVIKLLISPC